MFDPVFRASEIAKWNPGVKLPMPLADALAVFKSVSAVDTTGYGRWPTLEEIRKNPEQAVVDHAVRLGTAGKIHEALANAVRVAAENVISAANAAVPDIIDLLRPGFDDAVKKYAEAVALLPQTVSAETIANGSPSELAAYQEAKQAAEEITRIQSWLASSSQTRTKNHVLLIVEPGSREELSAVTRAADRTDSIAKSIRPDLRTAVELGCEFRLARPSEANSLHAELTKPVPAPAAKPNRLARAWEANYL